MTIAKHYAKANSLRAFSVFLADMPGEYSREGIRLAQCSYSLDWGGWSGDQNWQWENVQVAPRRLTDQERRMKALWGDLRGEFQTVGGTDEDALCAEIARRMWLEADQISLLRFLLEPVDTASLEAVPAKKSMR